MTSKLEKKLDHLIATSRPLSVVELRDEYMKDEGCALICNKLSPIDTITTLDFRGNDIQQNGVYSIVELLKNNQNITILKLEWNLIGLQNAISVLCDGLLLSSVSHLDLRNNKIDSSAAKIISQMLTKNRTLSHLDLRWNNLGLIGGQSIHDTLAGDNNNCTLTECLLSGNQIPVQILRSIDSHLIKNKEYQATFAIDTTSELQPITIVESTETNTIETNTPSTDTDVVETLQEEINDLFEAKTSLTEENEAMKMKTVKLDTQILDLNDKYDILQNERKVLQNKYDTDTKALQQKVKELELKLSENVTSRTSEKVAFENIKNTIEENHGLQINKLRDIKDNELYTLRESVDSLHIEINELKTANNTLRSEILENEIVNERKYIEFETNLRNECNKGLSKKINDLERHIKQIKLSRDDLENEIKSEKEKYGRLIEQIETEKNQYQEWLNEEQKAKVSVENDKRSLAMQVQNYLNVITQKNQQIESLKIALKETQKSIQTLENEHQLSMKRVLGENNRQTLSLDKSLRDNEQRLTLAEHRKRNLELRLIKIEDDEQRKMSAVCDVVKMLSNAFEINTAYNSYARSSINDVAEHKESYEMLHKEKVKKKSNELIMDDDDDETIIEIIESDEDESVMDYMIDHNTFNKLQKKKKISKHSVKA